MKRLNIKLMLLPVVGILALTIAAPTPASAAHPVRIKYGTPQNFVPASGNPTPPYPLVTRKAKFDAHNWCWSAQLYDASTGTYGPYDPSSTPPIFPADPGPDGGDTCIDPASTASGVTGTALRTPNLYGTFGPATIVKGIKLDSTARKLRLNLPGGTVVPLTFTHGTFLYTTNTQLGPVTITYRLNGVDVTSAQF